MQYIKEYAALIAALGLIGIEISPIKINPIKWFLSHIGSLLNQDIKKEVNKLADKVDKLEENQDFADVTTIQQVITNYHALLLSNGLDNNQYRRCFDAESRYNKYKEKYPGRVNGHLDAMFEAIHLNYLKGNILLMEDDNNGKPKK